MDIHTLTNDNVGLVGNGLDKPDIASACYYNVHGCSLEFRVEGLEAVVSLEL
jgi:hypothetical protein